MKGLPKSDWAKILHERHNQQAPQNQQSWSSWLCIGCMSTVHSAIAQNLASINCISMKGLCKLDRAKNLYERFNQQA